MGQVIITTGIAIGALVLFIWMLMPSRPKTTRSGTGAIRRQSSNADHSLQVGVGTGILGGDIEDAAVARYALSRTPKDPNSTDERDLGTALGMQNGFE